MIPLGRRLRRREVVVFVHVPKTAGTTLTKVLRRNLTERFDEMLVLLKLRLGCRDVRYRRQRVDVERPRGGAIPEELVEAATRANLYDLELYRFAVELFQRAPELGGEEFRVELQAMADARAGRSSFGALTSPRTTA